MLDTESLIIKFHEFIKIQYPDLTLQEVNLICRAPFIFLRKQMARVELPQIRFKYFGIFSVKKKRKAIMPEATKRAGQYATTPTQIRKVNKMKEILNLNSESNDEK